MSTARDIDDKASGYIFEMHCISVEIILDGPMAGSVSLWQSSPWDSQCVITRWRTFFDFSIELNGIDLCRTFEKDARAWRLDSSEEGSVESIPPYCLEARHTEFERTERASADLVHKHLVPAAVKIQRQFRLWQFRKNVVWNPHTRIGGLNLLCNARIATL